MQHYFSYRVQLFKSAKHWYSLSMKRWSISMNGLVFAAKTSSRIIKTQWYAKVGLSFGGTLCIMAFN